MAKIKGRFTPLFDELFEDHRWLMELDDSQKLLYILVLATCYSTNNYAPDDARYYHRRFNLRARPYQVNSNLRAIKKQFPKLIANGKKLSLLNYKGYKNKVNDIGAQEVELEVELEVEGKKPFLPQKSQKTRQIHNENPGKDRKKFESNGMPESCREILIKKGLLKNQKQIEAK